MGDNVHHEGAIFAWRPRNNEPWRVQCLDLRHGNALDVGHFFPTLNEAMQAGKAHLDSHGPHEYTSTACQHARHDECRRVCKFCPARCRCACHPPERARGEQEAGRG